MEEIWKKIDGYDYSVNNFGVVINNITKNKITPITDKYGYHRIRLFNNKKRKDFRVHQLVAMAFLNHKIDGFKIVVNHINGIKNDNRVENLELVTQRENASNCFRINNNVFTSEFIGVSWNKKENKWQSKIKYNGKQIHLGFFNDEIEAKKMYETALNNIINSNFDNWVKTLIIKNKSSIYKGVTYNKNNKKWAAFICKNNNKKFLGYFLTEIEAHEKYKNEELKLFNILN